MVVLSTAFVVDRSHMSGLRLLEIDRDLTPNSTHCKFSGFLFTSLSYHFSCQKSCIVNLFMKPQCSVLNFRHLTSFSSIMNLLVTFKPSFILEAGQILERSQQIQIL